MLGMKYDKLGELNISKNSHDILFHNIILNLFDKIWMYLHYIVLINIEQQMSKFHFTFLKLSYTILRKQIGVYHCPLCLHIARGRGGRVWALVELAFGTKTIVQVWRASPVPRTARIPRAACAARTFQRGSQLRRHFGAKWSLLTEIQQGRKCM